MSRPKLYAVVVNWISDFFLQQTVAESKCMKIKEANANRKEKHWHARLGYNIAWVLNTGVRESKCCKAVSAVPLAWVKQ